MIVRRRTWHKLGAPPHDKMTTAQSLFDNTVSMEEEVYTAVSNGDLYAVKLLVQDGADVCWRKSWPSEGDCALHQAALHGHLAIIDVLLAAGANISQLDDRGRTALHKAASMGHVDCIERLIAAGANCNHCDFDAVTPLHLACSGNHPASVQSLLLAGAEPNRNDNEDYSSPLIHSAGYGHLECIKVLLEHGADVNWRDQHLCSAVHVAASSGHEDCLSYLVRHGAELEREDDTDSTPLFHAADAELLACIDVLVTAGANCLTAVEHATSKRQWRTVELLLQHTEHQPSQRVLAAAITDVRLSTVAQCVQRGTWASEADVVAALVVPISRRGELHAADIVEESWLEYVYTTDRLSDLVELLDLLYEVGAISAQTLRRQLQALDIDRLLNPTSLKNMSAWEVRRCVRGQQGEAYEQLGLPNSLVEFVASQPIVERFKNLPAVSWE